MSGNSRNTNFLTKFLPGMNGRKHKLRHSNTMERSSSNHTPKRSSMLISNDALFTLPRARSHTVGNGTELTRPSINSKRSCSSAAVLAHSMSTDHGYSSKEMDVQMTLASPRHFLRRGGMVQEQLEGHLCSSNLAKQSSVDEENSNQVTVCFEQDMNKMKDSTLTKESHSLRDILDFLCIKHNLFLNNELDTCHITATRSGSPVPVNLDDPSTNYAACVVEIKSANQDTESNEKEKICVFQTVQDCISFFDVHGLEELPLQISEDDDSYRLPRVQHVDPIERSWAELPIDAEEKKALSKKELEQQQAIWELIYTEHSHLRNMDVIINIFMRCLELIRRAKLLTEDGYHNVFGYMEYIYNAHERFWTYTLEPCLDKVHETHKPLDLGLIFDRFPEEFGTHFEIYEQHCALEKLNLSSLNRAMTNPDFMAYLKWCEARPECNRLDLKAYLAMPMQRLTKYPLLISAISKKTTDLHVKQRLDQIWHDVHDFVDQVNSGVQAQEETERVKDAMSRITAYHVVDVPSELKDMVNQYTHLDLLAPMPDVEVDKQRVLIVEGSLKYRDHSITRMVVHIFLFTDVLLVTKPHRRGGDKFTVVRPPYKIASLVLRPLEPGSFLVIELNDFGVLTSWFILKAHDSGIAKKWMDHISSTQQIYTEAVERKALNWNYLQTLRSERILNGIDHNEALSTSLSNSLWSINNLSGSRLRNSMSSSNESLMNKRGSTPIMRSQYPPITRTMSVGLQGESNGQQVFTSSRLNGYTDFGSNPSLYADPSSVDPLSLERTSSLGKLTEKPYREHNMTMKTISETQLSGGIFTDEDFNSDCESSSRNPASEGVHEHSAIEELCSIDESLTSDDCSTQSSSDTQISNTEIIDSAAMSMNKSALSPRKLDTSMSPTTSSKFSPTRSPNISPLHQKLQCSLSAESRERLQGASISPTFLSTSNSSATHLKSILRSPSASITSLSSISPTHSMCSDQRLPIQTPPTPSTPTSSSSSSADRTHSVLIEGTTMAHSHTILPTSIADAPKNDKSPSPSPSMDFEVVACKTVVDDRHFCNTDDHQWLSVEGQQRARSQSDTSDNLRAGLEFNVTLIPENAATSKPNALTLTTDGAESNDQVTSPSLLQPKNKMPLPIIRQASDSLLISQRQVIGRPHRVMFSDCAQVLSFDSESNDSDTDEKIRIICDDTSIFDLTDSSMSHSEMLHSGQSDEPKRLPQSPSHRCSSDNKSPLHKFSKVSDKVEPREPSTCKPQQLAFSSAATSTHTSSLASGSKIPKQREQVKQSLTSGRKADAVPPAHKRVTGKHVRELSQMFESSPSPDPELPSSSDTSSPVHKPSGKSSPSKLTVYSEIAVDIPLSTENQSGDIKAVASQIIKPSTKVAAAPPKVASKPTKPLSAAKRKVSTTGRVATGSVQSPTSVRKVTPTRRNSIYQQKGGVIPPKATTTNNAMRRASRSERTPIADTSKNTSSPVVGARKQLSTKAPSSPSLRQRSSRSQTVTGGRDPTSSRQQLKSQDSNPSRSRLQRQPSVVSSRSPSPYSSGQTSHKPLSRLSGTRQPLRRKSGGNGSNNSSPASARKSSKITQATVIELNSNNSNNNNNSSGSDLDERYDCAATLSSSVTESHFDPPEYSSRLHSKIFESAPCLSPNSTQKGVSFNHEVASTLCSLNSSAQKESGILWNSLASGDETAVPERASSKTSNDHRPFQIDDQRVKLKSDIRHHHSLQSSSLKHANKRSPLEWQNFGLSWKQSSNSSLSYLHSTVGQRRVATSRRL